MIVRFFARRNIINEQIARNMLSWRHSGFSLDAGPSSERSERPGIDNNVWILYERFLVKPVVVFYPLL
jgi:hypothetical protein